MLEEIPAKLFAEWIQYSTLEPFGAQRDNIHAGIIATSVWQSALKPEDRSKVSPRDFLIEPNLETNEEPAGITDPKMMFSALKALLIRKKHDNR